MKPFGRRDLPQNGPATTPGTPAARPLVLVQAEQMAQAGKLETALVRALGRAIVG